MTLKNQNTPFASRPEKRSIGSGAREVKRIEDLEAKSSPEGSAGTGGSGSRKSGFVSTCFSLEVDTDVRIPCRLPRSLSW